MKRFLFIILCIGILLPARTQAASEKLVALTFDDGPSGRFTRRLLQGLEEKQVKVTFLLCGYRMAQYPQLTAQIHAQGHEIGLHGFSHNAMDRMTPEQLRRETASAAALLPPGCRVRFLRPPGGKCNAATVRAAEEAGLSLLLWSVDPRDWATGDVSAIVRQVLCQVRDGDVILLHDMSDSSVDAALILVDTLRAQGFRFVTVSELAQAKGIDLRPGKVYSRFP